MRFHLDYETRSEIDLSETGVSKYAAHPSTVITHASWRLEGEELRYWDSTMPEEELRHLIVAFQVAQEYGLEKVCVAHNAAFERAISNHCLPRMLKVFSHGWKPLSARLFDCTMARSLAFGLPAGLDKAAKALAIGIEKDKEGAALLSKYYGPWKLNTVELKVLGMFDEHGELQQDGKYPHEDKNGRVSNRKLTPAQWKAFNTLKQGGWLKVKPEERETAIMYRSNPEEIAIIGRYNRKDVEIEERIDEVVPALSAAEFEVWCLDQEINEAGVTIDLPRVKLLAEACGQLAEEADAEIQLLTNGEVFKHSEVSKITEWVQSKGYRINNLTKDQFSGIIATAYAMGDDAVARVVELREEAGKASIKKLYSMIAMADEQGCIRDNLQYYGAGTGRWAGRGVQMQNMARLDQKSLAQLEILFSDPANLVSAQTLITAAKEKGIKLISCAGAAIRSMLLAPEGAFYVGGDFSNIEGRINAWLAGETWKVQAFKDYDTFQYHEDGSIVVDDKGEPVRLGLDLYKLAFAKGDPVVARTVSKEDRQKGKAQELALGYQGGANAFLVFAKNLGFDVPAVEAEKLVKDWRASHPEVVINWWGLQDAAVGAVLNPGVVYPASEGRVKFKMEGGVLYCNLPSGRNLAYPYAEVVWMERFGKERPTLQYQGVDSLTKQWGIQSLYGGKLCENIVQALARDIMVGAMFRVKKAGFKLILTVHDELLTLDENPEREHELKILMSVVPGWAKGLPLAAECWSDKRYVK